MTTRSSLRIVSLSLTIPTLALLVLVTANPASLKARSPLPRLACGSDHFTFENLSQELAVVQTSGPNIEGPVNIYDISFPLNGLTPAFGYMVSGQPEDAGSSAGNTLNELEDGPPPTILKTVLAGSNSFSSDCCNEQMVLAPDGSFYHAHYGDVIQKLQLQSNKTTVVESFPQSDIVGMASDGVKIWISNWGTFQVGTWDPATNTFTPVFSTPSAAGGLAWDVANGVLWVGMEGGSVVPYDASGNQLGPGFQPFGSIPETIDGLAFVPGQP